MRKRLYTLIPALHIASARSRDGITGAHCRDNTTDTINPRFPSCVMIIAQERFQRHSRSRSGLPPGGRNARQMASLYESGMMRFSCQLVGIVCNGLSLSPLVGAVFLGVRPIDDKYRPACPRRTDRSMSIIFIVDHLSARVVQLPLVVLLEVAPVVVVALCGPPRFELGLPARASRGPLRVELVQARFDVHSNPSASLTSFRPIIHRGSPRHWISE